MQPQCIGTEQRKRERRITEERYKRYEPKILCYNQKLNALHICECKFSVQIGCDFVTTILEHFSCGLVLSHFFKRYINYWSRYTFSILVEHVWISVCLSRAFSLALSFSFSLCSSRFYVTQTHSNAHVMNAHAIFYLQFFSKFCIIFV